MHSTTHQTLHLQGAHSGQIVYRAAVSDRRVKRTTRNSLPPTKNTDNIRQHQRTHARSDRDADGHENRLDLGVGKGKRGEGDRSIDRTRRAQRWQNLARCLLRCIAYERRRSRGRSDDGLFGHVREEPGVEYLGGHAVADEPREQPSWYER